MLKCMIQGVRNSHLEDGWRTPRTCVSELGVRVLVAADTSLRTLLVAVIMERD